MGKEVKIGLLVIFVLLGVFGYALYSRLKAGSADPASVATNSADDESGDKSESKKDADAPAAAKLSSGPAKLSSGPTKLSSGPTKRSGDSAKAGTAPTMLSAEAAANRPATDMPATAANAATSSADASLTDFPSRNRSDARSPAASDRYGRYGESVGSSIDRAVDRTATALNRAASDLARDPFGKQAGASDANPAAALMQNVQGAASQVIDQASAAVDQARATSLNQARDTLQEAASGALDQASTRLDQQATTALDQAGAALDRAADTVAETAASADNPLRATLDSAKNAFDATRRDAPAETGASSGSSRSPRSRYDFYGDPPSTAGDVATTASSPPTDPTAPAESAAATASDSSATFRSQPSTGSGDRYGSATAREPLTQSQSQPTAPQSAAPQSTTSQSTVPAARSYDRYATPPGQTSTANSWTSTPRAGTAIGSSDARNDSKQPAATIADTAAPSASPPAARSPRYAFPSEIGSRDASPAAASTSASTPPRAFSSVSPAPLHAEPAVASNPEGKTYTVEPNDNYWVISEKLYGTGSYFKALEHHNRQRYPRGDLLRTGDVVDTPTAESLTAAYPDLCPRADRVAPPRSATTLSSQRGGGGRVYVVEEGDTLFDIARYELGRATRWAEIYQLNKAQIGPDFNHLRAGTQLVLPDDPASDTFTRRPAAGIQR